MHNKRWSLAGSCSRFVRLILVLCCWQSVTGLAQSVSIGPEDGSWALTPETFSRFPIRELTMGRQYGQGSVQFGVRLRQDNDPISIPDLGSGARIGESLDSAAIAQDIQAGSNRLLAQYPRKNALRMNWIQVNNAEYRVDLVQHPSRTGFRFHHIESGLRIEAERRLINSSTHVFVGVRLLEDRRFDPTVGCSISSGGPAESRHFCGFRLRVGL